MFTCCTRTTCLPWVLLSLTLSLSLSPSLSLSLFSFCATYPSNLCVNVRVCVCVCFRVNGCASRMWISSNSKPLILSLDPRTHARTGLFYAVGGPSPLGCILVFSEMLILLLQFFPSSVHSALFIVIPIFFVSFSKFEFIFLLFCNFLCLFDFFEAVKCFFLPQMIFLNVIFHFLYLCVFINFSFVSLCLSPPFSDAVKDVQEIFFFFLLVLGFFFLYSSFSSPSFLWPSRLCCDTHTHTLVHTLAHTHLHSRMLHDCVAVVGLVVQKGRLLPPFHIFFCPRKIRSKKKIPHTFFNCQLIRLHTPTL